MSTDRIKQKIFENAIQDSNWLEEARFRLENESWMDISFSIAVKILSILRERKISQKDFAANLAWSPQYLSKIIKGKENLTLETIYKLETALNIKLIEIEPFQKNNKTHLRSNGHQNILKTENLDVVQNVLDLDSKNIQIMLQDQIKFYEAKLAYEMDASDVFDALEKSKNIVVVDARKTYGFEKEHIPGAINLPYREMNEETTKHLDRSKTYVCYCDGIGCNASTKGALMMTKLGFKVKELIGGIEWWKFDGYATEGSEPKAGTKIQCAC
jgi:rhodanese-related sulfurtransferase/plasmid maintenance system antidote protein VapI